MTQTTFRFVSDNGSFQKFIPGSRVVKKKRGKVFANGEAEATVVRYDEANPRTVWLSDGTKVGTRCLAPAPEAPAPIPAPAPAPAAIWAVEVSTRDVLAALTKFLNEELGIKGTVKRTHRETDATIRLELAR